MLLGLFTGMLESDGTNKADLYFNQSCEAVFECPAK